jgi:hypothetical protein
MGSSSSTVTNTNNQTYINKSQIDVLNKQITSMISNTQVDQAAKCANSDAQSQYISFGPITSAPGYDVNITDIQQGQYSTIDFTCKQTQVARNDISNQLYTNIMNNLKQNNTTEIMAELEAQAATNVKNGFASWGGGSSNSDVNNDINWNVTNDVYEEVQNVIENSIENNFTANNLSECINNLSQSQSMVFKGITSGGGVYIGGLSQQQMADTYTQCIQNQNVGQEITNVMANAMGVTIENDNSNKGNSTQSGTATAETINNGPFESIGEMIGSILSGIGSLFGNAKASSIVCVIICGLTICCIVLAVIGWFIQSGFKPQDAIKAAQTSALVGGTMTDVSSYGVTTDPITHSDFGFRY